jgi:hypothetical protein
VDRGRRLATIFQRFNRNPDDFLEQTGRSTLVEIGNKDTKTRAQMLWVQYIFRNRWKARNRSGGSYPSYVICSKTSKKVHKSERSYKYAASTLYHPPVYMVGTRYERTTTYL